MNGRSPTVQKGRGAASNPEGRFERLERAREDGDPSEMRAPCTIRVIKDPSSIISRNDSPDIAFSQSINPYQGCEHACVYCYVRPSHSYHGLSPGLDFETRIFAKANAAELQKQELGKPGYRCEVTSLGTNTAPYQAAERELRITRSILEMVHEYRHPVGIVTKSSLIERDMDLLESMAKRDLVRVYISIATLDAEVARTLELRATAPGRRIKANRALSARGISCGVFVAPVVPFVTNERMERVHEAVASAGASSAGYVILRLPYEVKDIFREWLEIHYPLWAWHVMACVNDMRGGVQRQHVRETHAGRG